MKEQDASHEHTDAGIDNRGSTNVSLHIERLVIDGVPLGAGQAAQLQEAVQRELLRLLQRDGVSPALQGGAIPALAAPNIEISAPLQPAEVGRQIARSVYASLNRGV